MSLGQGDWVPSVCERNMDCLMFYFMGNIIVNAITALSIPKEKAAFFVGGNSNCEVGKFTFSESGDVVLHTHFSFH